jgi:centromeric protein E
LQQKLKQLEQQLAASSSGTSLSSEKFASGEHINELKKKIQSQVIEIWLLFK